MFILFQMFPEDQNIGIILICLFIGFSGFFLFVLLLTIICVTLAHEDQILLTSDVEPLVEESSLFVNYDTEHPKESTAIEERSNDNDYSLISLKIVFKLLCVPS